MCSPIGCTLVSSLYAQVSFKGRVQTPVKKVSWGDWKDSPNNAELLPVVVPSCFTVSGKTSKELEKLNIEWFSFWNNYLVEREQKLQASHLTESWNKMADWGLLHNTLHDVTDNLFAVLYSVRRLAETWRLSCLLFVNQLFTHNLR